MNKMLRLGDLRVYVGCALTHASPEFKLRVADLKRDLARSYRILDFAGLSGGFSHAECRAVFDHDIGTCVGTCHVFVAICDQPSTGLGIEIWEAHRVRKVPVLLLAHEESTITRLLLGIPEAPNLRFQRYKTFGEVPGLVDEFVGEMARLVPLP